MKKLLIILMFALFFIPATSVKAEDKTLALNVNETFIIDGQYFGTTDESIAKVNDKGIITGIASGKCEIISITNNVVTKYIVTIYSDDVLYIDKDGLEFSYPTFTIDDTTTITLGKTKLKDLKLDNYKITYEEFYDASEANLNVDDIDFMSLYLVNKETNLVDFKLLVSALRECTLGDNYITGIYPYYKDLRRNKDDYVIKNYYWYSKAFSIDNSPNIFNFYTDIYKKFSGYVDDNLIIQLNNGYYGRSNYQIAVKLKMLPSYIPDGLYYRSKDYLSDYYLVFDYDFNGVTGECKAIGCYISKYVNKSYIGNGYCSFSMYL